MTVDEAKACLRASGFQISAEERLTNGTGTKLSISNGAIVNVYDSGKFVVQGKNQDPIKECLGVQPVNAVVPLPATNGNAKPVLSKVFVVYGHNSTARTDLEAMLRCWRLEPLILDQLPNEGQTIIEKLEKATSEAKFGIVLATPDDEGHRAGHGDEKAFRARQNVVLELGMMLALLGRKNVAILMKQQDNMERPSDIQGLIYITLQGQSAKRRRTATGEGNGGSRLSDFGAEPMKKARQPVAAGGQGSGVPGHGQERHAAIGRGRGSANHNAPANLKASAILRP